MKYATTESDEARTMPHAGVEYVDDTPRRPRRSKQRQAAEDELGHHFVSVIATEKPLPREFGDNRGWWSIHTEVNADWRRAGVVFDQQQPVARAVRLEVIGCHSKRDAVRLKAALDEALHGRERAGEELRHRFRNMVSWGAFEVWWGEVLFDCVARLKSATPAFEVFSRVEHESIIDARERRQMAAAGRLGGRG